MTKRVRSGGRSVHDVVVVGGGIIGTSAATHLAEAGVRVMLVERTAIGAGASGRNSGVIQHPFDPVLSGLHLRSLELYRDLDGLTLGACPAGLLSVTRDADAVRVLAAALAASHPRLSPAFISPDEMRDVEPTLAEGVAACRLDIGYPVGPATATRAYAARAERAGVRILLGDPAVIRRDGDRVVGVRVGGEEIAARDVLVAAGPRSPEVVAPSGQWRPIRPRWGVVVGVTLREAPRHVLEEAEISIEPGEVESGEPGHAFSLVTADGSSSLGSTFLVDEPDAVATVPALVRRGIRFVPSIAHARIGAARVCARPQSLDGRPLIGRVPGIDGLWLAAGHGPWGISTGPATGLLIAELISGVRDTPPPELDPARLEGPTT